MARILEQNVQMCKYTAIGWDNYFNMALHISGLELLKRKRSKNVSELPHGFTELPLFMIWGVIEELQSPVYYEDRGKVPKKQLLLTSTTNNIPGILAGERMFWFEQKVYNIAGLEFM